MSLSMSYLQNFVNEYESMDSIKEITNKQELKNIGIINENNLDVLLLESKHGKMMMRKVMGFMMSIGLLKSKQVSVDYHPI